MRSIGFQIEFVLTFSGLTNSPSRPTQGSLVIVEQLRAGDSEQHREHERNALDISHHVGGEAEIIYHVVADMGEIHVERYEIDGEREIDPGELLVLYVVLEVEYAEELLGECAALAGL